MNNPEIFNQNILNQITSEIVVLDKDLKVVWINDSAITNNWKISDEHTDINSQFSFQTNAELNQLIDDCIDSCLLYTSPSPRDISGSRMPSSA